MLENNSLISCEKLDILRLKCKSCGSTHAILPADVIPYKIFSLSCIVFLLAEHFVSGTSILEICEKFNISFQLMYLFIKYFTEFIAPAILCLRVMFDITASSYATVLSAINDAGVLVFSMHYFLWSKIPFLMTKFQVLLSSGKLRVGCFSLTT